MRRDYITPIIFFVILIVPFIWLGYTGGTITIERPYLEDYNQCKAQIEELSKSVQCPEVNCNCGAIGIFWTILGAIFLALGYGFFWNSAKQINKLQEAKEPKKKGKK